MPSRPRSAAACGGDALGGPGGVVEEGDFGVEDGLEAGEAVVDLGGELGVGGFVVVGLVGVRVMVDAEFLGDAGDVWRRGLRGRG